MLDVGADKRCLLRDVTTLSSLRAQCAFPRWTSIDALLTCVSFGVSSFHKIVSDCVRVSSQLGFGPSFTDTGAIYGVRDTTISGFSSV